MDSAAGNHPWEKNSANQDEIPQPEIIPERRNQQIEMKFLAGNHPCEKKPANRDEIPGWKSSLREETNKSG